MYQTASGTISNKIHEGYSEIISNISHVLLYEISKTYQQIIATILLYSFFPRIANDSPNIKDENFGKSKISKL